MKERTISIDFTVIRRILHIDCTDCTVNGTKRAIVTNKMAPPFKTWCTSCCANQKIFNFSGLCYSVK